MNRAEADAAAVPKVVDRAAYLAELEAFRLREKAHTREVDALAAARRRLPMVAVDGDAPLIGAGGTVSLDAGIQIRDHELLNPR